MADFIERNSVFTNYYLIGDPILKRYLQLQYEWEIRKRPIVDVGKEETALLLKRIKDLKAMLGYLLESHVKYLMTLWNNDTVNGELFGVDGKVKLPRFNAVYHTLIKSYGDRGYEVDAFAYYPHEADIYGWAVECRYRNRKANAKDIEKFHDVLKAVKKEKKVAAIQPMFPSF